MKKKKMPGSKKKKRVKQVLPRGWTEERMKSVIDYYDKQTEEEELAEYEAAVEVPGHSLLLVPSELVPEIERLISRRKRA